MAINATDRIGDRLDHPERVPAELQHLIQDDIERVNRILEIEVHGRIIDVGCSDGAITRRIAKVWEVEAWGADLAAYRDLDASLVAYVAWDARQPFPAPVQFEAVYACEILEHLTEDDANRALTNLLAVLKPDGRLVVTVPNRHPHDLYEVGCRSRWAWPDHRSSWTYAKLRHWLTPHLRDLTFVPIYADEGPGDSIWLLAHGVKR